MSTDAGPPYARLSVFYFFYFASIGVLAPYWALYLQSFGFDAGQIGELLAILIGTKLIAPYVWGALADHTAKRVRIVRIGAFIAAVAFLLNYRVTDYRAMVAVTALYGFFWNAILPQFEAVSMNHLGRRHHRYSVIRLWGSVGFIAAVLLLGPLVDRHGPRVALPVLAAVFILIWLSSLLTPPDRGHPAAAPAVRMSHVVFRVRVLALLAVCFLMHFSHGAYYAFFSIYLERHGYSKTVTGWYWALGVVAEVFVFLMMAALIRRYGAGKLLVASAAVASVRWVLTALFVANPLILAFTQIMHAATFGLYHAAAITLIHHHFSGKLQGRGQALYNSIGVGVGGATGSLASGYSWDTLGSTPTYLFAAAGAALAVIIAARFIRDANPAA